jgi:hypothetical protein
MGVDSLRIHWEWVQTTQLVYWEWVLTVDHHRITLTPIITLRIGADHQFTTQMGDWCWPPNHNTYNGWCQQMITLGIQPQDTHSATQHHHQHKILVRFSILIQLSDFCLLVPFLNTHHPAFPQSEAPPWPTASQSLFLNIDMILTSIRSTIHSQSCWSKHWHRPMVHPWFQV